VAIELLKRLSARTLACDANKAERAAKIQAEKDAWEKELDAWTHEKDPFSLDMIEEAKGERTGSLLAAGIVAMLIAGLVAMLLAIPLAEPVMSIAFGSEYSSAATLLVPFIGATTLLGALLILVNHHVARSDHRFVWAVGGLAILQIVLLIFFSTSSEAIIAIDAIVGGVGLVVHELIYFNTDESMLRGAGAQFAAIVRRLRRRNQGAE
jgi:hypothetical protein